MFQQKGKMALTGNEFARSLQASDNAEDGSLHGKWQQCLQHIRESVSPQAFKTWLDPIIPVSLIENQLILRVPSQFFFEWLESHYRELIQNVVKKQFGLHTRVEYLVASQPDHQPESLDFDSPSNGKAEPASVAQETAGQVSTDLDPRYQFDNFLAANDNELALRAALAVAKQPGKTDFNPLFIYGDAGCGKTHLLNAIGNHVISSRKRKKVRYLSSENFLNEYIFALQNGKLDKFNKNFLQTDVILFDDIQYLSGKKKSQEGLYYLLSEMERRRKQVVIVSNQPPSQLLGFKRRLSSFFQKGLIVDLIPPSSETRRQWIDSYCAKNNLIILPEVREFLAQSLFNGMHQMRAAMVRIAAQSSLLGKPASLQTTRRILTQIDADWAKKNGNFPRMKSVKIEDIIKAVSEYMNIPQDLLVGFSRQRDVTYARQIAIYLCKEITRESYQAISYHFSDRHYTAILHNYKRIANDLKNNAFLVNMISEIKAKIFQE